MEYLLEGIQRNIRVNPTVLVRKIIFLGNGKTYVSGKESLQPILIVELQVLLRNLVKLSIQIIDR